MNTEEPYDELVELRKFNALLRSSLFEWLDKTHWVQITSAPHELGLHRADVLKGRVESLQGRLDAVEGQRDLLLKACQTLVGLPGTEDWQETLRKAVQQARTAIKAVEGEKT